jgi:hypothetical protein
MTIPPLTTSVFATPEIVAELRAKAINWAWPFEDVEHYQGLLLIASRIVTGRTLRYVDAHGRTVGEEVLP